MSERRTGVFVLEDDPFMRALLEKVYRREGYDVWAASNVAEALELWAGIQPGLLVLDYQLPDGHAIDFLRGAAASLGAEGAEGALPPSFLLTANLDAVSEAEQACFGAVRGKPCSIAELRHIARSLLTERHRRYSGVRIAIDPAAPDASEEESGRESAG